MNPQHNQDFVDAANTAIDLLLDGDDRLIALRRACETIATPAGIDRIAIVEYEQDSNGQFVLAHQRFAWRRDQSDISFNDPDNTAIEMHQYRSIWARPGLSAGPLITQTGDAGKDARTWLEERGISTNVSLPVHILDRFTGSLNLIHTGQSYRWSPEELLIAGTLSRPLVSAYLRYETSASLDVSDHLSREAFEKSTVGMTVLSADGTILEVNDALCRLVGYERQELIGRNTLVLAHPEDVALVHQMRPGGLMNPEITDAERRFVRRDGETVWTQCSISLLDAGNREPGPGVPTFAVQVRDITSVRQASVIIELERSNRELEQFAYIASHDLQEPLRMITSYLELLQRRYAGQLDDDADEFIGFAVDGARRMRALVNSLLVYSRLDSQPATHVRIELQQPLEHALQALRLLVDENNACITYDELPAVMGDVSQLSQLFQNLLENAIKFRSDDDPEIHVSATRERNSWTIEVRDNGIGFDPEQSERIFGVFRRLHRYGQYPGTGIGLAICKRIVERHGGRIEASSTIGDGSTFRFTLPTINS